MGTGCTKGLKQKEYTMFKKVNYDWCHKENKRKKQPMKLRSRRKQRLAFVHCQRLLYSQYFIQEQKKFSKDLGDKIDRTCAAEIVPEPRMGCELAQSIY